jgi:putative tricarboxylic transport membrane protein
VKFNDAVFGLLLLALGAAVLAIVQGYPKIPGQQVGPAIFPGLIGAGLCICGALFCIKGWMSRMANPWAQVGDWARSGSHLLAMVVVLAGTWAFIVLGERLGFFSISVPVLWLLMVLKRLHWGRALICALAATLLIHLAFYKLLRVPLPWGLLPVLY